MTTVRPVLAKQIINKVSENAGLEVLSLQLVFVLSGTFANFVNGELVGLILDVLNGGKVEVTRDTTVLFIEELHCLSCNVHHTCSRHNTEINTAPTLFVQEWI